MDVVYDISYEDFDITRRYTVKYTLLLVVLIGLYLVPAISQEETVIKVSCDDPEGCFGKVAD